MEDELYKLILKFIQPVTYKELTGGKFWLKFHNNMEKCNNIDQDITEWSEFKNELIGRSVFYPLEQMEDSTKSNIEKIYQVF